MISKDDVKRLAELSRTEMGEKEQEELAGEMDSILGFVSQVSEIVSSFPSPYKREGRDEVRGGVNVMREDSNPNETGFYTERILAEMPNTERGYLKVKKIL